MSWLKITEIEKKYNVYPYTIRQGIDNKLLNYEIRFIKRGKGMNVVFVKIDDKFNDFLKKINERRKSKSINNAYVMPNGVKYYGLIGEIMKLEITKYEKAY